MVYHEANAGGDHLVTNWSLCGARAQQLDVHDHKEGAGWVARLRPTRLCRKSPGVCFSWEQLCLPGLCSVCDEPETPGPVDTCFPLLTTLSRAHLPHGQSATPSYFGEMGIKRISTLTVSVRIR